MAGSKSGLSEARLGRLNSMVKGYIDSGEVVGAITLVDRHGESHVDVQGLADRERKIALKRDAIFRIASMSKPITAAATMILVEEGKVRLDEPVDRLLPELAGPQVLVREDAALHETVPAIRPITVRDCLTFRLGHGLPMGPGETPIQKAINEHQIFGLKPATPHSPDEWIRRLGMLPLMHQPGEGWLYHVGSDVLGVLIARAADMPLEDFLKQRIFGPLGMKDTGFSVPAAKTDRLTSCYSVNMETGALDLIDDWKESQWSTPPAFPMGGGGLVSTADDYLAFARMMLAGGKVGGERILSRPSIETMTSDQLTEENRRTSGIGAGFFDGSSWGFGVRVITQRTGLPTTPGSYGWGGAYGTIWNNDPKEDMITILMVQRGGMGPGPAGIGADFPTLAYQAIDD